eukprot:1144014-Pelagomonas_calceolata.AAC.5
MMRVAALVLCEEPCLLSNIWCEQEEEGEEEVGLEYQYSIRTGCCEYEVLSAQGPCVCRTCGGTPHNIPTKKLWPRPPTLASLHDVIAIALFVPALWWRRLTALEIF